MFFMKEKNKRLRWIQMVSFVLLIILAVRLAILTLAEGEKYREIADNKRVREVYLTPPRGEIRDRNGQLLAGNQPVFTLQLLKDELDRHEPKEINDKIVHLFRLLEQDGVSYMDEFPIVLNIIRYKEPETYVKNGKSATDYVVDQLINRDLLRSYLMSYYTDPNDSNQYHFITINRAINALNVRGLDVPINVNWQGNGFELQFDSTKNSKQWKHNLQIAEEATPLEAIVHIIGQDRTIIKKILNHPLARSLAFETLEAKGNVKDLELIRIGNLYEENYRDKKMALSKAYPQITMETSAQEDFCVIFQRTSLRSFLEGPFKTDSDGRVIDHADIYITALEESGIESIVEYEIARDTLVPEYHYIEGVEGSFANPVDWLISQGNDLDIIKTLSEQPGASALMQQSFIDQGIYPEISIADGYEYTAKEDERLWRKQYNIPEDASMEEALDILSEKYELEDELSIYDKRAVMNFYYAADSQGYNAYIPLNFAYGLKDSTVAQIEEQLSSVHGLSVEVQPVRYYPRGKTAAHILGYLGKISQPFEMEKYGDNEKYSLEDMIGKTGIEESFEDLLKGEPGFRRVEVDSMENTTNVLYEKSPSPGNTVYLSIDVNLQEVTEYALEKALNAISTGGTYTSEWGDYKFNEHKDGRPYFSAQSGAAIVVDVRTGEVLAMASYPSYDPNLFATGITTADWESLMPEYDDDPLAPRPLFNIATQTAVQPGSIFKMLTGLTALEKGMPPDYTVEDMGFVRYRDTQFNCWAWEQSRVTHGAVDIVSALRDSCNYYFYSLMLGENQRLGTELPIKVEIEDLVDMALKFGLDKKTGIEINVPLEVSGSIPEPEKKLKRTQDMMRVDLTNRLETYYKDEYGGDELRLEEIIDEIISWTEMEEPLERHEVTKRLEELGINGERRPEGNRQSLTDYLKYSYLNHAAWHMGDSLNVAIGQGQNEYTLAQMVNYIATIANGGYLNKLSVIHDIRNNDNSRVFEFEREEGHRIELNDYKNLDYIKRGMQEVSDIGTAARAFSSFPVKVATKTGTAERAGISPASGLQYDNFAWTVGFAPYDDPEIAVATILVQGGSGGHGGPIIRDIIAEYMGLSQEPNDETIPIEKHFVK